MADQIEQLAEHNTISGFGQMASSQTLSSLALDALCRAIDISIAEALDRPAPEGLAATNHVLS